MRYLTLLAIVAMLASSCTKVEDSPEYKQLQQENELLKQQAEQDDQSIDTFISSFEEIQANLDTIKAKEKIITARTKEGIENNANQKDLIKEDIQLIYNLMQENKKKIATLNKQLKNSQGQGSKLQALVKELEQEIIDRDMEIESLKTELTNLDIIIENLVQDVDKLATESEQKSELLEGQRKEMNRAYYVVGEDKDLKNKGVITKEGGFIGLGKTEKISPDIDVTHFTQIDILNKKAFAIGSKKAKVISVHPSGSYELKESDKMVDSLIVKDPYEFWKTSKYLVVVKD